MVCVSRSIRACVSGVNDMLLIRNLTLTATIGGQRFEALRDVSLEVQPGEVVGLVGESGAGKSMIGRVIAGLVPNNFAITRGRVEFDGIDMPSLSTRARRRLLGRHIAFIPQEPLTALDPVMTIGQSFAEHLALIGVPASERRARMLRHLGDVHLPQPDDMVRRYPHQLSGGQCQRVLIAMAFAANPALIVADEPTTALDVVSQANVLRLLREQQRQHRTAVLLVTHDLRLAAHVCDRIAVLYAGEVAEYGPAADVLSHARHPYTWALQHATPDVRGEARELPALPGQMPGLSALAALGGCRFSARCARRREACDSAVPPLGRVDDGHDVRCIAPMNEEAAEVASLDAVRLPVADLTAAPLLALENVGLRYSARRGVLGLGRVHTDAVSSVSLTIRPGEFVGIVGESGSGKSSIARMIVGAERPTSGRLMIDGHDRLTATREVVALQREQVQMIFQDPHSALNPRRSVYRLLTQAYEAAHAAANLEGHDRDARARELLRDVGLPADALERFPSQLSGGQKQRVNIGRALCAMPRLVVADEIVSGLDVSVQAQILNLLVELGRRHGIALLLISHDLSVVRYLCTRVLVMQRGQVVEEGPTEEVFANPRHAYTRLLVASVPPADASIPWPPAPVAA